MAKDDRNARTRSGLTGETYRQALEWIRAHGLTFGLVPDADTDEQQILEAAVLRSLTRPPLDIDDSLFGLARVSPGTHTLTLWPAGGAAGRVLSRLLPAITADTRTGIPTLRATDGPANHLTLHADGPARVLIRATQGDYRAARALLDDLGARLLEATPNEGEQAAWRQTRNELADEAQQWSTALRRIGLFLGRMPDWSVRAPSAAETEMPADRIAARPHGPAVPARLKATVAVTSWRGGEGRSTIAFALAEELARAGSSVVLLSADEFAYQALQHRGVTP
ncbi:hypothetical protein [Kitasatospora sp. NPDC098663]|uniref:hypothetical protein n=1 Tax=Kitasatospora sp. NPDC098663 TaxID=3364096 RepID=UPI0037F853DA